VRRPVHSLNGLANQSVACGILAFRCLRAGGRRADGPRDSRLRPRTSLV
jgi:hypothetical protein